MLEGHFRERCLIVDTGVPEILSFMLIRDGLQLYEQALKV